MNDDLIQQLREELARYQDLNRQLCDKSNCSTIMIARLEEQLAEAQKQNVMLRDAIIYCKTAGIRLANVDEALNATQDLSSMVLCDAEPAAWMRDYQTLAKELVEAQKQNTMLRDALKVADKWVPPATPMQDQIRKALAATTDLSNCILCDAEPVAWLDYHSRSEEPLSVGFDKPECIKSFNTDVVWREPLYKARKAK